MLRCLHTIFDLNGSESLQEYCQRLNLQLMDRDVHGNDKKPFVPKFGCFVNCKGACVFMKHVVENHIWWCGEDSAKD